MITINCIGAGRWGPNVIRSITNLPDARVRMVCDLDEERLDRVRRHFSDIATTTDVDHAIEDAHADAIVIATPVRTHHRLARAALDAGKHVLVEKPLAPTLQECDDLIERADRSGLTLAVGHVFLFNAGIRKVKEYIDSGVLGRILYVHATRTNLGPIRDDVNAAWDLASHDLSIFDHWLGASPIWTNAYGQCFLSGDQHDVVVAAYRYPRDVMGFLHVSWLNPRKVREITVVGDRKMAVWNDMDLLEPVRLYDKSASTTRPPPYADSFGATRAIIRDGDVLIPKVSGPEPLSAECADFVRCIRTGEQPMNDGRMATAVVETLIASQRSVEQNGERVVIERAPRRASRQSPRPEPEPAGAL